MLMAACSQSGQDATAPEISDISAQDLTATSIVVVWTTNEPATSRVDYGLTDGYGRSTSTGSGRAVSHSVTLMGLAAGTTYHYRVYSEDASGKGAFSPDRSFSTPDIDAPLITEVSAGGVTGVGATISWTTSEPATSQVDYGLTDQYGQSTALDAELVISHSVSLTGLSAGNTYHYRVRSKDDSNHEGYSGDYTFDTSSVGYLVISPATAAVTAGSTRSYTAEAFDQFNNSLGNVTTATVFSIQSGAGGSWSGNVYTSEKPGVWSVTGTYTGLTGTATLTVSVGSVASIIISPSTSTVIAGNTQAYTAEAFDLLNNSLGDVTTGTVFSIAAAAGGSWVANVYTSRKAGTWTVTGSYAGRTDTANLTVTKAAPSSITISPATSTVTAGDNVTYTVEAFDQSQNSLGDVTVATTFSIEAGAGGSWTANIYTSQNVGSWMVTATYAGIPGTATVTVAAGAASRIEISPAAATITAGGTQSYGATAFDQSGNSLGDVTADTDFSITAVAGGSWGGVNNNIYTAEKSGTWTVTGDYGGVTDDASLTVVAGPAASLDLTPDGGMADAGVPFNVTVTAYDDYGNVATGYRGTVQFTAAGGPAILPADYTFTESDNGVRVFSLGVTFVLPGSPQSVQVTDTEGSGLIDSASWIVI
jgi:hypothetical protein